MHIGSTKKKKEMVNSLFCSVANSPQNTLHYQNMLRFMKFTTNMQLRWEKKRPNFWQTKTKAHNLIYDYHSFSLWFSLNHVGYGNSRLGRCGLYSIVLLPDAASYCSGLFLHPKDVFIDVHQRRICNSGDRSMQGRNTTVVSKLL